MGRAFEFRRARKEKRWDKMAKAFTKIGKDISIAVKQGGADPENNPRLRVAIANAKGVNMPKERVDGAIKRAVSKDAASFQEIVYEGYGPCGIAILVECATDNPTRTVANIRSAFTRSGGTLGTTGSLDFLFQRKGVFTIAAEGVNAEELELELIDHGAEDFVVDGNEINVYTSFTDFVKMQKALDEKKITVVSAEMQRLPLNTTELSEEDGTTVMELIEKLEEDEDVQAVYHTIK